MLSSIGIHNFKSYQSATLPLAPLTVLIGANASGKSNALEALRLLSWIAQGNRLGSIKYAVYEADDAVRGNTADLGFRDSNQFSLRASFGDTGDSFEITIKIDENGELHISGEKINTASYSTVPLYEVVGRSAGAGSDLRVAYNNFARGGKKPQVNCNDQMAVMIQLQSSARFEAGHKQAQAAIPETCKRVQSDLSNVLFLDPQPSAMRQYSFKTETRLLGSGSNISGVLFNLCSNKEMGLQLLALIRSLPEQDVNGISFVETPRGEVMVQLEETFGRQNRLVDATLLSDGTLRVLSIAAAVLSAPPKSLVVIEEIDNGVHPSRAGMLLGSISEIAKRRGLRVLISSHNPALLDALPDDAVPNVVFCYRDIETGSSKLVRLSNVPDYPDLIAQGSVGHLMTSGTLERFVKSHPGPAARRERAKAWLEQLRGS